MPLTPFQRKIRSIGHGKFLSHRFKNLPEKLESEELEKLVIELKSKPNNEEIRNKIINSHLRLGVSIASRYGSKHNNRIDDLVGEMFLALVEGVIKFCKDSSYDNNITPYLVSRIHGKLSTYIENDRVIHMPGRTVRHYTATGSSKLDKIPNQVYLNQGSRDSELNDSYEGTGRFDGQYILPETVDDNSESEVLEILNKVTNNFIEKRIIQLRAEGYSYREIGPMVGYSQSSIATMIAAIEKRFDKKYKTG
jgi:RNA polymerase sigma factor (sigma-70 family)